MEADDCGGGSCWTNPVFPLIIPVFECGVDINDLVVLTLTEFNGTVVDIVWCLGPSELILFIRLEVKSVVFDDGDMKFCVDRFGCCDIAVGTEL